MIVYDNLTLAGFYSDLVRRVLRDGERLNPRSRPNVELRPVLLTTGTSYPCLDSSKISYRLAAAELIQLLAGWDDLEFLTKFCSRMSQFSDDGVSLRGAYGRRLRFPVDQLQLLVDRVREDPDTRQAVLHVWKPEADLFPSKDLPCNTAMYVKVREGELDLTVFRRSADLVWGVPYDHFVFCGLARFLAALTDTKPGTLRQYIDSLHVYQPEANFYSIERVDAAINTPREPPDWPCEYPFRGTLDELRDNLLMVRTATLTGRLFTALTGTWYKQLISWFTGGDRPCW